MTFPIVLQDNGVFKIEVRPLTDEESERAAQVLQHLPAAGVPAEHLSLYWHGRVRTCIESGWALGLWINGGAPNGVALALPDVPAGVAVLYACETMADYKMGDHRSIRMALLDVMRANVNGYPLVSETYSVRALLPSESVLDAAGAPVAGAAQLVERIRHPV